MENNTELTYEQALDELKQIIEQLENNQFSLDEVVQKIDRAKFLFQFCYNKLKTIKNQVDNILDEENFGFPTENI